MAAHFQRARFAFRVKLSIFFEYKGVVTTVTRYSEESKMDDLEKNPFMAKYGDKIKELQRSDPDVFQSKLDAQKESKKKRKSKPEESGKKEGLSLSEKPQPQLLKDFVQQKKKGLDSVVKVDMLKELPPSEIERIWKEYHKDKDRICAVIPKQVYEKINETSKNYPMFLYALPRKTGFEFFFAQFEGDSCYFTSLVNYQAYQENAPILLTMTHYTELQDDKGIVLLTGELNTEFISVQDAQFLANQLQLFYATGDTERQKLLDIFNNKPAEFKHMDIIKMLQSAKVGDESDQGTPID